MSEPEQKVDLFVVVVSARIPQHKKPIRHVKMFYSQQSVDNYIESCERPDSGKQIISVDKFVKVG